MTGSTLLALTMTGTGLWCLPSWGRSVGRLHAIDEAGRVRGSGTGSGSAHPDGRGISPVRRRAVVVATGLFAVGLLLDLWPWWIGAGVSVAAGGATLAIPQRRSAAELTGDRQGLAVHADLLAACLETGMSVGAALLAVPAGAGADPGGRARPGAGGHGVDEEDPFGVLDGVAALLLLGAHPPTAWARAAHHPDLANLAAAALRTASGGAALAQAVREHAAGLRASIVQDAARSAGRAGVAVTAPLGLCFLPAFLCLGLAPVVVGLLSSLHLF